MLNGQRLWVTRPSQQAACLIGLLQAAGAEAVALPLLEIAPPDDPAPLLAALATLEQFDLAVFISPSALDAVFERLTQPWPASLAVAVVGPGSERRARELGVQLVISPASQFDSEGLLAEPA
ncbi:MAG: uroporphyrinogen-III synthase, partial [Burkholderiales bacterium]|nr:uroporphyrinogen-III synthase [Burkholderiales bacterium]